MTKNCHATKLLLRFYSLYLSPSLCAWRWPECLLISDIMDVKYMLEKLGQAKTHLELKKMIKEVDTTNTEAINYRDFVRMMLGPQSGVLKMYVDVVLWPEKYTQLFTSSYLYICVYIYVHHFFFLPSISFSTKLSCYMFIHNIMWTFWLGLAFAEPFKLQLLKFLLLQLVCTILFTVSQ